MGKRLSARAALGACITLAACASACSSTAGDDTPARPPRPSTWHVAEGAIRDASGRTVILRGVNLAGAHKVKPYVSDFGPADYQRLRAEWGMNALRFLVSWQGLEPARGTYDETYLAEVEKRIGWARDAGLYVVLDVHQDLYGEGFAGGNGVPRWTCDEARYAKFVPATPWFFGYLDANVMACFDGLYTNADVRSRLVLAWKTLATRFARYENVLGFDALNEPHWGSANASTFEAERLAPLYEEIVRAVRSAAPAWLFFMEPSSGRNLGIATSLVKPPYDGVVYAPHAYDPSAESGDGFDPSHRDPFLLRIGALREEADALGAALLLGEYGGMADKPGIAEYMTAAYDGAGAGAASAMYWAYDKNDDGYALLRKDGSEKKELVDVVVRPYPERTAGRLLSYAFDRGTKVATIRLVPDPTVDAPTEIAVPRRVYSAGVMVDCGGCTVEELPGLVRLSRASDASNARELTITIRPR